MNYDDISLDGKVALVTGSSRGIGKGIAHELGAKGATVYVTGRTVAAEDSPDLGWGNIGGTLSETAKEIDALGGKGITVQCDHARDDDVKRLFDQIARDHGGLDILVNNAYPGPVLTQMLGKTAWEQSMDTWDQINQINVRSAYLASVLAVPYMIDKRSGLIANISSYGSKDYMNGVAYGMGKAAIDKLTADLGHELAAHNVTTVSLWPGAVRTEIVLAMVMDDEFGGKQIPYPELPGIEPLPPIDYANTESPRFIGRAVAAFYSDENGMERSGQALSPAELALEYGYTDIDGAQPPIHKSLADAARVLPRQTKQ